MSEITLPHLCWRILLITVLLFVIAACGDSRNSPARVESLRQNMPALEEVARNWRPDAYLSRAEFPILDGNPTSFLIAAGFQSPTESAESLLVWLETDGVIATERVPHTVPVIQDEPITQDDWTLDSAEALEVALDVEGQSFLEEHADSQCSFLVLERAFDRPDRPVVWWMRLTECFGGEISSRLVVIDALTGEVLSRE